MSNHEKLCMIGEIDPGVRKNLFLFEMKVDESLIALSGFEDRGGNGSGCEGLCVVDRLSSTGRGCVWDA
jgi:hypothetical protein